MLPNWQSLNIAQTQEDVILAVSVQKISFSSFKTDVTWFYY